MTHIYVIAGESSGDFLGSQAMKALKEKDPNIYFSGIGGPLMEKQGLKSLFSMQELSLMGVLEILPHVRKILKRIKQTRQDIEKKNPDIILTIDAPDFCLRVVKELRKKSFNQARYIHYVAPTVWAWRAGRAKKLAGLVDGLVCLFDFEPPYFKKEGLNTVNVGHPAIESGALEADGSFFREKYNISPQEERIGLLFGSRKSELKRLGQTLKQAALQLNKPLIIPSLPHLEKEIRSLLADYPHPYILTTNPEEKWSAFAACNGAIAVSGTVALELALVGIPHVIAFNMTGLTWQIVKRVSKVRYAHLANIMLNEEIVPEFIQNNCRPELIAEGLEAVIANQNIQREHFETIRQRVGMEEKPPSQKAADFILRLSVPQSAAQ